MSQPFAFARRTGWNLAANRLSELLQARRAAGQALIDLTVSNPTRCGFAYDAATVLASLARAGALTYAPEPLGLASARAAVARYYERRGRPVDPARLLLTASTSEAYAHLFRLLCNPGDAVHRPRPSYPLFDLLASLNDVELRSYELLYDHGWHLDISALEAQLDERSRALLLVHPNNPTGSFLQPAEWERLQAIAAERGLAIVLDEVFIDYAAAPPAPLAAATALTFTLNGLSKIAALPQMKLGWAVVEGPEAAVAAALARLEVINDTYLSVSTPVQAALPELLESSGAMQAQIQARLRQNLARLDAEAGIERLHYEGGWTAVLRLPRLFSGEDWAEWILEREGVLVHPGHFYDFAEDGYLVVSLIVAAEIFAQGVAKLSAAVRKRLG